MSAAREAAADALAAAGRGRRLDLAFDEASRTLDDRDRAFARELAWGTVRLRGRLDHLLARHLDRPTGDVEPVVLDALRLGAYQALEMGSVPPYAAVSQAVAMVRARGRARAAGFVNAVLRALVDAGAGPENFPDMEEDPAGFLSTWGAHPRWLIDRWLERWTPDEVLALVEADNRVPPLTFVPVGALTEAEEAVTRAGGSARRVDARIDVLEVEGLDPPTLLARIAGFVQDPGAALVARYATPPPDARVADLCAAPGGKALYLARSAAYVVAVDPSAPRIALVRENAHRTGLPVGAVRARAEAPPLSGADLVLVDAPCTGTGTLRRHPDARWRLGPDDPARMARVQLRLLEGAAAAVPSGGLLVYSTCTLEPEENEGVVERFLEGRPEFEPAPPEGLGADIVDSRGWLTVLPQRTGFDGAFAARLRRR